MASSPLLQIPSTAVDAAGLSVATSIRSVTDPRPGQIYDSTNLAAAVPIHFHPTTSPALGGGNYLMLNSLRWTSATVSSTNPGAYTAFTSISIPNWVLVNAATGNYTVINSGYEIPMTTPHTTRTLTAATSRGLDLLWTLNSVTNGATTSAVVQNWHTNQAINTVNLLGEETIPSATSASNGDAVNFSAGIQWSSTTSPYMYFYGLGTATNYVYSARKAWARVGHTGTSTQPLDTQWEFYNGTGWGTDTTAIAPVQTVSGPLTSVGPISFGHYAMRRAQRGMSKGLQGYNFVSTVQANPTFPMTFPYTFGEGSARGAQIYSSLGGRPWQPFGDPIPLGISGSTYMGSTVQFQGAVGPNPAMVDSVNSGTAIPYVSSVLSVTGGLSSLEVNWNLLQVPRLS